MEKNDCLCQRDFHRKYAETGELLYLKNSKEYSNITSEMVWRRAYSFDFCDLIPEQFLAAFAIESEKPEAPEDFVNEVWGNFTRYGGEA